VENAQTWKLIHSERAAMADTLEVLTPEQWAQDSLCTGWTVREAAGHILSGAEQTPGRFMGHMAMNGFRFNTMMDVNAKRLGAIATDELVSRLRQRTTTTNRPPAPVKTMLGEIVVHSEDIRRVLGITATPDPAALVAVLDLFATTGFPVDSKRRISGLSLVASDVGWVHGDGPQVNGSALSLLLAMTGRPVETDDLDGDGAATLRARSAAAA
jgi:uncharacterized protein (TIGR03083 family)